MDKSIKPVVIIPNLNGGDELLLAIESLTKQTLEPHIIVVDNASTDGSVAKLKSTYPKIELMQNAKNLGFAAGVNPGLKRAVELRAEFAGPFNDDAIADVHWLERLVKTLRSHPEAGAVAPKVLIGTSGKIDSTGDFYTNWGLPHPRGRGEIDSRQYDDQTDIFAASGAASLYRVSMLKQIGLFDEDFFAYYEDVDLSFRAQLAGWKIRYVPSAIVYHKIGATSSKMKGFTTYQTIKNLPWLFWKNVPAGKLFWTILPRFSVAYTAFVVSALVKGKFMPVLKGAFFCAIGLPKKTFERHKIQKHRVVAKEYIASIIVRDLPPNAHHLRKIRAIWYRIVGKK